MVVNQLHGVISNRGANLTAHSLLLLSALESVMLGGAKHILGCSSKTCNEAARGDVGLEPLQDKSKLNLSYKLASMSEVPVGDSTLPHNSRSG